MGKFFSKVVMFLVLVGGLLLIALCISSGGFLGFLTMIGSPFLLIALIIIALIIGFKVLKK